MSSDRKAAEERAAFRDFARRSGRDGDWLHVQSRDPPEPDLLCVHRARGLIAFELVSLTDSSLAQALAQSTPTDTNAFWTADPSTAIVRKKLHRTYTTPHPIELLIYSDPRLITPDDVVIHTIQPLVESIDHPFRRVWFMGEEEVACLWATAHA